MLNKIEKSGDSSQGLERTEQIACCNQKPLAVWRLRQRISCWVNIMVQHLSVICYFLFLFCCSIVAAVCLVSPCPAEISMVTLLSMERRWVWWRQVSWACAVTEACPLILHFRCLLVRLSCWTGTLKNSREKWIWLERRKLDGMFVNSLK